MSAKEHWDWVVVAHAYNPSYLGGWDQEDYGSRPAQVNSSQDPIFKITRVKWTAGMAQAVECLLCMKSWVQILVPLKKKKGPLGLAVW
jgi:hypothetical protein